MPADTLRSTIEAYNAHVEAGDTDEFGRVYEPTDNIYNAVIDTINEEGPFYAVVTKCMNNNTLGGITVNESLQVLTEDGTVIPGLYAAGECVAVWGRWLSGGTGVNGAITFGRLAGQYMMEAGPMAEGYAAAPAPISLTKLCGRRRRMCWETTGLLENLNDGSYSATVDGQEGPLTIEVVIERGQSPLSM